MGLIFAEFTTFLKSPKIDIAKNKPYHTSSLRVLEIVKIELSEYLTHLASDIFAKICQREKFPIYGTLYNKMSYITVVSYIIVIFYREKLIQIAFQSLQLVVTDFLPIIPCVYLQVCVEVIAKFGLQEHELNISLTSIGLLVSVNISHNSMCSMASRSSQSLGYRSTS